MTVNSIAEQTYYALGGGLPREFYYQDNLRKFTVNVRYDQVDRGTLNGIDDLYISTPSGQQVPLKSVADVRSRPGPTLIEHDGPSRRVISVLGFYRRGGPGSMDLSMAVMSRSLMARNFPPGYGMEMRGDMTQMMDSFNRILRGLALAMIFIFLTLIAQFRGFAQPFNMMLSLPLELAGVFGALYIFGQAFSTVSILAIVILTGMDITVAILLIDLILRLREQGVERRQAILEGASVRLRPILMTSFITIVVLIPVAFFPKTGLDAYSPLATVVVGGLSAGTFLSLFVIPCLYTYVDDFGAWVSRRFRRQTREA
jgi:HAE1 family hydrophobic/amphiphilic exporter-1